MKISDPHEPLSWDVDFHTHFALSCLIVKENRYMGSLVYSCISKDVKFCWCLWMSVIGSLLWLWICYRRNWWLVMWVINIFAMLRTELIGSYFIYSAVIEFSCDPYIYYSLRECHVVFVGFCFKWGCSRQRQVCVQSLGGAAEFIWGNVPFFHFSILTFWWVGLFNSFLWVRVSRSLVLHLTDELIV